MKAISTPVWVALCALLVSSVFSGNAFAQLNEDKITRDASGIFKGKIFGGTITYVDNEGIPSEPFAGPVNFGKSRVPIKDGRNSTVLRDDEVGGDDSCNIAGKAKDPVVRRSGKLIQYGGRGGVTNPGTAGNMTGVTADGTFTDRGAKWTSNFHGGGNQNYPDGAKLVYKGRRSVGAD